MARRPKGSGHLSAKPRKDGLFEAVWFDRNGGRHTLYSKDRKVLGDRLAEAIAKHAEGVDPALERLRLDAYLAQWLKEYEARVKPSTWSRAEELFRLHVAPRAGRLRMQGVLVQEMRSLQLELLRKPPRGAGLAPRTVKQLFSYLHLAFHDAEPHIRRLGTNPLDHVAPPAIPAPEPVALEDERVHHLLATARATQPRWYPLYALLAVTGLDVGMALALRRDDLDLLHGGYVATRSVRRVKGHGLAIWSPKTTARKRSGGLHPLMVEILQAHLAVIDAEKAAASLGGVPWAPETEDVVFPLEKTGGLKDPGVVINHHWQEVLGVAGVAPRSVRLKDFRSTAATILNEERVDQATIQRMLGHAQGSTTTRRHYTKVTEGPLRRATEALGFRVLDGGPFTPATSTGKRAPDGGVSK